MANPAGNYPEDNLAERFSTMDMDRQAKLSRSRVCAQLTVPQLLPPENWTEQYELPQPFSSAAAKGVTGMSSRILSALMPLNDMPFFQFNLKDGTEPDPEAYTLMESLSYQVYRRLSSENLRSTVFQLLQSLIVVGDCLLIMEDDFSYRLVRLDQYQVRRDVKGKVREIIYLEYELAGDTEPAYDYDLQYGGSSGAPYSRTGYKTIMCRWVHDDEEDVWYSHKEYSDGQKIDEGKYEVCPVIPLRWSGVISENYGRSHCEENFGDIQTLEALTETMLQGQAASSTFWMVMNPTGPSELDDVVGQPNGAWLSVRPDDVTVLSPADTLRYQMQAVAGAVQEMRQTIAKAFLNEAGQIRTAERVTATEVRMVGQQLEEVLGGAFSSIARDLMVPLVKRAVFLMIEDGEIDPRLASEFAPGGRLDVSITTGLQALSNDSDLQKLMQLGEMVRNLPEEAAALFQWEEYGRALVGALGFDPRNWVRSKEEVMQEQQAMQAEQMQAQAGAQVAQQGLGAAADVMGQAAGAAGAAQAGSMITDQMNQAGITPGQMPQGGM
jgi:hypothetical protein